ncbi:MAG: YggT family protein [Micrococcales bacterium]|nr:YggT family protein [Micrococcales bacterium]
MALALTALAVLVQLYLLALIARLVLDLVMVASRRWRPSGASAAVAEVLYTVTDPPLKLARRIIPPLRLGSVNLDLGFALVMLTVSVAAGVLPSVARGLSR